MQLMRAVHWIDSFSCLEYIKNTIMRDIRSSNPTIISVAQPNTDSENSSHHFSQRNNVLLKINIICLLLSRTWSKKYWADRKKVCFFLKSNF
jgi:hypothetical protein